VGRALRVGPASPMRTYRKLGTFWRGRDKVGTHDGSRQFQTASRSSQGCRWHDRPLKTDAVSYACLSIMNPKIQSVIQYPNTEGDQDRPSVQYEALGIQIDTTYPRVDG
jgi:hypothetical protein